MIVLKRSVMTLYSDPVDIYSHQVRIVLAEKGIGFDTINVDVDFPVEDLLEFNPYGTLPTLVDRELILFNSHIIMEYLDERFPHPPLLPVYPVARAKCRLLIHRIEKDLYSQLKSIERHDLKQGGNKGDKGETLKKALVLMEPIFKEKPYFMNDEFTLVDCVLFPLLWRLSYLNIQLPNSAKAIVNYIDRLFDRESLKESLSEIERGYR
ncbi:stringent starvation protein A [Coxiella-like endosymbiont of Amblyomma americanum]|uniref:glutathione S-transferase N-terminal domain-containing protein n=1 Tax=Coxiella-like endosymbiont of Amblyomma americanum TaxID=1987500 RepID=UPI000F89EAA7|nr:glutathione S-transferase N-terminal domain-containing protein [Coxiella-like endosymbiont of Amblyomma americanum]AUJ58563.1 stringent starvation protein A [Coxiella-like endosymbiont of Amblyomma americanum]